MLPPGLGFVCASPRAIEVAGHGGSPRNFFDWRPILEDNAAGFFPYTPATLVLFGLREALEMLFAEGLDAVFARHHRLAEGVRAAVRAWGLGILCEEPDAYSNSLTVTLAPSLRCACAISSPMGPPPITIRCEGILRFLKSVSLVR